MILNCNLARLTSFTSEDLPLQLILILDQTLKWLLPIVLSTQTTQPITTEVC